MSRHACLAIPLLLAALSAQVGLGQIGGLSSLSPAGGRTVPGKAYDLTQVALAMGNLSEAIELAEAEFQGAMKLGTRRWIDSAAAAAMIGECQFELGQFRAAVTSYDEAILQTVSLGDWLLDIRYPDRPLQPRQRQQPQ
ncbi:MAG: tetratricopeptide repeat protein, partial [Pirellulales bacterium]